jgi:hypothetical protein
MFTDLKNYFKSFLVLAVGMFFWPTMVDVFSAGSPKMRIFFMSWNSAIFPLALLFSFGSAVIGAIIVYKGKRSENVLAEANEKDRFWNEDDMIEEIRSVFYKVQNAWENNNAEYIKDYATPSFLNSFKELLKNKNDDSHIIDKIEISEIEVIGCQEFFNKKEDKFEGYIKGSFATSTINPVTNEPVKKDFSELYYFVRIDNDWILNMIDYKFGIWDILSIKNICE